MGAAVLVVAAVVGWWVLAASADVRPGSFSSAGRGHTDRCSFPDEGFWAVYAGDQEVVAVQTIRNDAPWSVEVTSRSPDAFRLGALAADPGYDASISDPAAGPPPEASDRVVIPAGREVALWIVDPQPEDSIVGYGDRTGYDRVPVRLRSLGIPRDTEIDLEKTHRPREDPLGERGQRRLPEVPAGGPGALRGLTGSIAVTACRPADRRPPGPRAGPRTRAR